ncbi:MAG: flagellar assembly protein FliW [Spirochaetes bacterium]|jgi:flagellar assembly factor FliW|nr:flagellar assembly protein FliW [Spirochaetota bacterium]
MEVDTKAYGRIEVDERQHLTFPRGLYGFEEYADWVLLDARQRPFYWLQSTGDARVAFILINPYLFRHDYVLNIPEEDLVEIGSPDENDVLVFAVVTIPEDQAEITANLQGPLVVNRKARIGKQSISLDPRWETKHPIVREMARNA